MRDITVVDLNLYLSGQGCNHIKKFARHHAYFTLVNEPVNIRTDPLVLVSMNFCTSSTFKHDVNQYKKCFHHLSNTGAVPNKTLIVFFLFLYLVLTQAICV